MVNLALVVILYLVAARESEASNFPLKNCSTEELDILALYFDTRFEDYKDNVEPLWHYLIQHIVNSFDDDRPTPRVTFAEIFRTNSQSERNINFGSWLFSSTFQQQRNREKYYYNVNPTKKSLKEILEIEIKFVHLLFSQMGGVRENATHVGIIFLDGAGLSQNEAKNITEILDHSNTDVKIFIVVFVSENFHKNYVVYLGDALILAFNRGQPVMHYLLMAMCRHCKKDFFSFGHRDGSLSCYFLEYYINVQMQWILSQHYCLYGLDGYLVGIETQEELNYLKRTLSSIIQKNVIWHDDSNQSSDFFIHIGLRRNLTNFTRRFQWWYGQGIGYSPLVLNNWLPGKPSSGSRRACAAWQFRWERDENGTNIVSNEDRLVDGWTDVGCKVDLEALGLCEMVLPRKVEEKNLLRIKPATNESLSQALAKGDFVKYGDNIVSVSTYISDSDFRRFYKETGGELFPLFDCGVDSNHLRYISYQFVCGDINLCNGIPGADLCGSLPIELEITASRDNEYFLVCPGVFCCDEQCLLSQWVNDGEVDCPVCEDNSGKEESDESKIFNIFLTRNETCAFICDTDHCIKFSQLNDGSVDCPREELALDETVGKLETADTCYNVLGHRIWAPRCVYVMDIYGAVLGCRDMSHLKNCTDFKCPEGYVKCPNTYCIPQRYVLDRKKDCPAGEDEDSFNIEPCIGNFACWDSKMCLHPDLVCDGHSDCPHKDDEIDCHVKCAEGFRCVSKTVTVSNHSKPISLSNTSFIERITRYVDLSGVDLSNVPILFFDQYHTHTVILRDCQLRAHPTYKNEEDSQLQILDFSYNLIRNYTSQTFNNLRLLNVSYNRELVLVTDLKYPSLEKLDLSHTSLSYIDPSLLQKLSNLKYLSLSFTLISGFRENTFYSNSILHSLEVRGLFPDSFYEDFFNGLTIRQHLYTDSFQMCCPQIRGPNILYYMCHAPDDAISSCFDLIGVKVQCVLLWVVAVLAVLGNTTVIVYRVIWDRSVLRTGYGLFVTNLGICDFIMGVYLFFIAGADYYYRDVYVLYDKNWRESFLCKLAGFLATLSSESSTFFIFLITLDRFLIIKFPFGQIKLSDPAKIIVLLLSWIIGFLLALTPIVFRFEIYSSNVMCLGLPLTTKRLKGWEFSFGVFIVLNCLMCLIISYSQRVIYQAMSENRITRTASSTSPRRAEDIIVAKQLSLVALSNFLCWFPIGLMGLLSFFGREISTEVYSWTTVVVLPINSAANPLLYTIPVLMDKWDKFKHGGRKTH